MTFAERPEDSGRDTDSTFDVVAHLTAKKRQRMATRRRVEAENAWRASWGARYRAALLNSPLPVRRNAKPTEF